MLQSWASVAPLTILVFPGLFAIGAASVLVGRERELEFLETCWQRTGPGHGGLVLIRGEAGVGKTRLAEEFAGRLRWQGARVLWGRCFEFERLLPYQPISEALRTLLPTLTPAELADLPPWIVAEVARLVPEMAEQHPGLEVPDTTDASPEQARIFNGVAGFLRQLSFDQALLLVVHDFSGVEHSYRGQRGDEGIHGMTRLRESLEHLDDSKLQPAVVAQIRDEAVELGLIG